MVPCIEIFTKQLLNGIPVPSTVTNGGRLQFEVCGTYCTVHAVFPTSTLSGWLNVNLRRVLMIYLQEVQYSVVSNMVRGRKSEVDFASIACLHCVYIANV